MMAEKEKKRKSRKERIAADKWVIGERLTKAGRERGRRRRTMRKVGKVLKKGGVIKTVKPASLAPGSKERYKGKYALTAEHKKALGKKQKIRKGAEAVTLTKGGAYAKYGSKTKAAAAFRKAFKTKCAKGAETFKWDGRSYSCAVAKPAKKVVKKPAATTKTTTKANGKPKVVAKKKAGTYTPKAPKTTTKKTTTTKKGKKTLYQYLSGGKTAQQERDERTAKRKKKREAAFARRRNR